MEPNWNDFKILLALECGGSVAAAARELAIDKATVSRRLAALEEALGTCLLLRGGREFAWTVEGQAVLAAAKTAESAFSEATRLIQAEKLEVSGSVRLSCPTGLAPYLSRMLPAANAKYPGLSIEISGVNRTVDLVAGEADIAVRAFRPDDPSLVIRFLCDTGFGLYASQGYIDSYGLPSSHEEISKHKLVLYTEELDPTNALSWLEQYRSPNTLSMRADNTELARDLVSSGAGIGVIPCFACDHMPELVRIFPVPVAYNALWIVYHESLRDTARVRACINALGDYFAEYKDFVAGHCKIEDVEK